MEQYGHILLTNEQQETFLFDPTHACPICGFRMTQKESPSKGDSWWYTCINKHATWIGK